MRSSKSQAPSSNENPSSKLQLGGMAGRRLRSIPEGRRNLAGTMQLVQWERGLQAAEMPAHPPLPYPRCFSCGAHRLVCPPSWPQNPPAASPSRSLCGLKAALLLLRSGLAGGKASAASRRPRMAFQSSPHPGRGDGTSCPRHPAPLRGASSTLNRTSGCGLRPYHRLSSSIPPGFRTGTARTELMAGAWCWELGAWDFSRA